MDVLLNSKLKAVNELKVFTEKIIKVSLKTEYDKINSMIEQRQAFIEKINSINEKLNESCFDETNETKAIKKEIRATFKEIADMDNIIRKNISDELKEVKKNLSKSDNSQSISIKA